MDDKEYLKQISASVRPEKKPKTSFMSSTLFKVSVGGLILFILIMIIGNIINGGANVWDKSLSLKYHLDNTTDVISIYQKYVKSSALRSNSASLYSVLSNTSRGIDEILTAKSYKSDSEKDLEASAALQRDALESDLFDAKINGTLDRIYAHKMAYEIMLIMTEESEVYNASGNDTLKGILSTSYGSLDNLHNAFNNFSETK